MIARSVRGHNSRYAKRRSVSVWIARPLEGPPGPLVLHLTGDSGCHGLDLQLFTVVTGWGYPVVVGGLGRSRTAETRVCGCPG